MIVVHTINDEGTGIIVAFNHKEVEYVDAIKHISESRIEVIAAMRYELCMANNPDFTKTILSHYFLEQAKKDWKRQFKEIRATKIPENFIALFGSSTKAEQEKLLRDQCLNHNQFWELFFASSDCGYTFSNY